MDRRNALKNLGLFTGGMLLLPSCDFSDEKVTIILNKLNINAQQESILTSLVDTLLPETDTPGGLSTKCHNFVWAYIDDCTSPEDQENFIAGLNEFDRSSKQMLSVEFNLAEPTQRQNTLEELFNSEDQNMLSFLNGVKGLSVWCYTKSEYFLTKEMPYKLVPGAGSYVTCKTIDPNEKINSNA